jgi:hypothetical protein
LKTGRKTPKGAILLFKGRALAVKERVSVISSHGYGEQEGQYFVAGVRDTNDKKEKFEALSKFVRHFSKLKIKDIEWNGGLL